VSAFAQDINNHLERLPVNARPDSTWYRVGRFASRHKIPAAAAAVAACALLVGATVATWQARTAAAERDRAIAFASRNEAVTEFLGRVITEAVEAAKPVTVSEMLTRSENMALRDTGDSAENRAAILEMIADRYIATDNMERGSRLMASALALVQSSPDRALRARITCKQANVIADGAQSTISIQIIARQLGQLAADPDTASQCLLSLSRIYATEHHGVDALRYAQLGLEKISGSPHASGATEAALLGIMAFAYHLNGRNTEADRYFGQAMQKYTTLGRERSDGALTVLNDWAVALGTAGMPRRALQLIEETERIQTQREAGAEPDATTLGNRAQMLRFLGRFEAARATYERECQLAREHGDNFSQVHCQMGLAALAVDTQSTNEATEHLSQAVALLGPQARPDIPPMRVRAVLQGRIDLAAGRLDEARLQLDQVLKNPDTSSTTILAEVSAADLELAAHNPAAAVEHARRALESATTLQGNLPHSNLTGIASLTLGRTLQEQGKPTAARTALESAVTHLSNTVDADNPALVQARTLLAEIPRS
jgi:tetratricopeptide (TPR) repeat protein